MTDSETKINQFQITMERTGPMQFVTTFDNDTFENLYFDEPKSIGGEGKHPNASRILTAAVMNCLSASLIFCLKKSRVEDEVKIKTSGTCTLKRNDEKLWRISEINVELVPLVNGEKNLKKLKDKFSGK